MRTSDFLSASGLHMGSSMKRVAVAILAMVVLTGCGVGADESYDGQTLVGSNGQALEAGPSVGPEVPGASGPQTPATTAPSPVRDPSIVALPQDPIPVYEGRPFPQSPPPMVDPMLIPVPSPGIR
jgi:hypothetical protein